ncbi:LOW QUALITY PROTEIN: large ribosomal subunit protein eL8-like [Glossophaga mutica]
MSKQVAAQLKHPVLQLSPFPINVHSPYPSGLVLVLVVKLNQKLAHKYQPETKQEKKQTLLAWAKKKVASKGNIPTKRPPVLRAGVNTVTTLVENQKAQLEVMAHDVDPKLLVFLPTLCQKMGAPYCVTKGEVGLQRLIHRKTCTTSTFTQVNSDKGALAKLVEAIQTSYKDRYNGICCHWGGNALGPKSVAHITNLEKDKTKELATKLG